jgi:hypothetical protein
VAVKAPYESDGAVESFDADAEPANDGPFACRLSRRRHTLQAPSGLGLTPALAFGSGSAPAVRRISAAIEACGEGSDGEDEGEAID